MSEGSVTSLKTVGPAIKTKGWGGGDGGITSESKLVEIASRERTVRACRFFRSKT